jgi:hypothetical protein
MIDLALSDNTLFVKPSAYYAPGTKRTGQHLPANKPLNTLSSVLRAYESGGKMYIEDSPAEAGKQQGDLWYFPCPQGITSILHDVAVPSQMLLDVYGNDGVAEKLLAQYNPNTDGDDKTITPSATVYGVEYRAMLRTVTGATATGGTTPPKFGPADDDKIAQGFVLDAPTRVYGFIVRLKKAASVTGTLGFEIFNLDAGLPDQPLSDSVALDVSTLTTSFADYLLLLPSPVSLVAGSYAMGSNDGSALSGQVTWESVDYRSYGRAPRYDGTTSWMEEVSESLYFHILGDGSICQPEVPTGTGDECTVDNTRYTLANVWGTIAAGGETACYLCNATIPNTTTGKSVSILLPMYLAETLSIDLAARSAILTGNGESVLYGVTFPEGDYFAPGANVITYEEDGMANTDLTLAVRDKYQ